MVSIAVSEIKNQSTQINKKYDAIDLLINNITSLRTKYKKNLKLLNNYFDETSGSIGRYNDSLEIYNFKLLENILYSIGIIILIYNRVESTDSSGLAGDS